MFTRGVGDTEYRTEPHCWFLRELASFYATDSSPASGLHELSVNHSLITGDVVDQQSAPHYGTFLHLQHLLMDLYCAV